MASAAPRISLLQDFFRPVIRIAPLTFRRNSPTQIMPTGAGMLSCARLKRKASRTDNLTTGNMPFTAPCNPDEHQDFNSWSDPSQTHPFCEEGADMAANPHDQDGPC